MAQRERSSAYPSLPLDEAVTLVNKVRDGLGRGDVTREQIAPVIGHDKLSGSASSKIAALAHYGLLDKGKGEYRVSPLATKILSPVSDEERIQALREAALKPTLFVNVYDRYSPEGKLPQAIEAIMHREFGVTREASKKAHENLVRSLCYAGLLDEATRSFGSYTTENPDDEEEDVRRDSRSNTNDRHTADTSAPSGYQVYELPMSFGTAKVTLPPKLTAKDFGTLESLVGLVKHFVSSESAGDGSGRAEEDEQ